MSQAPKEVLDRAERLGTLDKIVRAPQYRDPKFAKPEELLRTVNIHGDALRAVQHDLYNLKLRNGIVTAVVTAVLVKAPEILTLVTRLFR
jgi:hypothetical protein